MIITRVWAMPSPYTFSITPISGLLNRWLKGRTVVLDPFSGTSKRGTHRNDLASSGKDAEVWVRSLKIDADAVLFDPPYSPRQVSECYKSCGLKVSMRETQSGALYKRVRDALDERLVVGGIAISCGWNSGGFGKKRGYRLREILLVAHGGAHNDTIVVVEEKLEHSA